MGTPRPPPPTTATTAVDTVTDTDTTSDTEDTTVDTTDTPTEVTDTDTTWARGLLTPNPRLMPMPPSTISPDTTAILMDFTPTLLLTVVTMPTPSPPHLASNTSQSTEPPMVSLKSTKDQLTLNPRLTPRPPPPTTVITAVDTVTDTDSDTEDTTAVDIMVIPDTVTDMVVTTVNLNTMALIN